MRSNALPRNNKTAKKNHNRHKLSVFLSRHFLISSRFCTLFALKRVFRYRLNRGELHKFFVLFLYPTIYLLYTRGVCFLKSRINAFDINYFNCAKKNSFVPLHIFYLVKCKWFNEKMLRLNSSWFVIISNGHWPKDSKRGRYYFMVKLPRDWTTWTLLFHYFVINISAIWTSGESRKKTFSNFSR